MVMPEPYASHSGDRTLSRRLLYEEGFDPSLAAIHDPEAIEVMAGIGQLGPFLTGNAFARPLRDFRITPKGEVVRGGPNRVFVPHRRPLRLWWLLDRLCPSLFGDPWSVMADALHNEAHGW